MQKIIVLQLIVQGKCDLLSVGFCTGTDITNSVFTSHPYHLLSVFVTNS